MHAPPPTNSFVQQSQQSQHTVLERLRMQLLRILYRHLDVDGGLSSVGTDLGTMGPDAGYFGEFWLCLIASGCY